MAAGVAPCDSRRHLVDADLRVGFAFQCPDQIEWLPGLDVLDPPDGPPLRLAPASLISRPTWARTRAVQALSRTVSTLQQTRTVSQLRRTLDRVLSWEASLTWPLAVPGPPPSRADIYRRGVTALAAQLRARCRRTVGQPRAQIELLVAAR